MKSRNAVARVAENRCLIAWVRDELAERTESYSYAVQHAFLAMPQGEAIAAERAVTALDLHRGIGRSAGARLAQRRLPEAGTPDPAGPPRDRRQGVNRLRSAVQAQPSPSAPSIAQDTAFAASSASLRWLGKGATRTITRALRGAGATMRTSREGSSSSSLGQRLVELAAGHDDEFEFAPDRRAIGHGKKDAATLRVERDRLERAPRFGRDADRTVGEIERTGGDGDRRVGMGQPGAACAGRRDDLGSLGGNGSPRRARGVPLGESRRREDDRDVHARPRARARTGWQGGSGRARSCGALHPLDRRKSLWSMLPSPRTSGSRRAAAQA